MSGSGHGIRATILVGLAAVLLPWGSTAAQQGTPRAQGDTARKIWEGAFTPQQALRGKSGYEGVCARCHGVALTGGADLGPVLKGPGFLSRWDNDTLGGLYTKIRDTMPQTGPGTISEEVKIEILAYLLQQNGFPPGTADLTLDVRALEGVRIGQRSVWDGIFTAAQAERGKASAGQGRCTGCHGVELGGTDRAPALTGSGFLTNWEDGSVNRLFEKVRDTMPPGNTDMLPPASKLDVIAFLLRANGFPAGPMELTPETNTLESIKIVRKGADVAGAPNFALVQVVGCLASDAGGGWMLTNATEPVITRDDVPTAAALGSAETKPLGKQTLRLVSVRTSAETESFKGHKVEARGLLYREQAYADLNLTSLRTVASGCSK